MKPMLPASGFCLSRSVRPDDAAEPLTSSLTGVELDLVSCICSSRIDACCCLEDRNSNAQRPRGDCGKWFTLAAIGSGLSGERACEPAAASGLTPDWFARVHRDIVHGGQAEQGDYGRLGPGFLHAVIMRRVRHASYE